jgi:hypothetical protein
MCVTAGGESLMSCIVIAQDSEPVRRRLMNREVRLSVDFVLRQQSKPYINGKLFLEYINSIFISYLNKLWELEEFKACKVILLMDNCLPHILHDIVAVLTRVYVKIIITAIHKTYIFKMPDVVLFGTLKKHATDLETLDEKQSTAAFLLTVYHEFKQTKVEANTWRAFAAISFTYVMEQEWYGLFSDGKQF